MLEIERPEGNLRPRNRFPESFLTSKLLTLDTKEMGKKRFFGGVFPSKLQYIITARGTLNKKCPRDKI